MSGAQSATGSTRSRRGGTSSSGGGGGGGRAGGGGGGGGGAREGKCARSHWSAVFRARRHRAARRESLSRGLLLTLHGGPQARLGNCLLGNGRRSRHRGTR